MKLRRSFAVLSLSLLAACAPTARTTQGTLDQAGYYGAPPAGTAAYGAPVAGSTAYGAAPAGATAYGTPAGTVPAYPANTGYAYGAYPPPPPGAYATYAVPAGQYPPDDSYRVRPRYEDDSYHLVGEYNDGESHPLRLASFALAPVGFLAEWLVTRPIHRLVAQQDLAPIFSYTPIAGYDYETYQEGLSTGVTFEDPQFGN